MQCTKQNRCLKILFLDYLFSQSELGSDRRELSCRTNYYDNLTSSLFSWRYEDSGGRTTLSAQETNFFLSLLAVLCLYVMLVLMVARWASIATMFQKVKGESQQARPEQPTPVKRVFLEAPPTNICFYPSASTDLRTTTSYKGTWEMEYFGHMPLPNKFRFYYRGRRGDWVLLICLLKLFH